MSITQLNNACQCIALDAELLDTQFALALQTQGVLSKVLEGREHLFAPYGVFVNAAQVQAIQSVVDAVESVAHHPDYQAATLKNVHSPDQGTQGVFMGYDFHLEDQGAQLIEINTNAGGAYLNALMLRSQRACCEAVAQWMQSPLFGDDAPSAFAAMFRQEWQLARAGQPLHSVLIIDEKPQEQFLYPEFELFRTLFRAQGWWSEIADPADLHFHDGKLWLGEQAIDMVYNRLTDFDLSQPRQQALRAALDANAVVVTPAPRQHALYADKRNLVRLSDAEWLDNLSLPVTTRDVLARHIPQALCVTRDNAEHLWQTRKQYFFKPATGYGSKAAYRGDKLTLRVWQTIIESGQYIAQRFAPPSERKVKNQGIEQTLKFDLRAYTYADKILLLSARLYQGQTTNLRTPLGGFAAVFAERPHARNLQTGSTPD